MRIKLIKNSKPIGFNFSKVDINSTPIGFDYSKFDTYRFRKKLIQNSTPIGVDINSTPIGVDYSKFDT